MSGGLYIGGDTSGSVLLYPTPVAGATTITIAAQSGTLNVGGPCFSAYTDGTTQTVPTSTLQKVLFANKEFDTNNNFASSRFTPTVAGYYQINAQISWSNTTATGESFTTIYKNGSRFKDGGGGPFTNNVGSYSNVAALVYANGSTDYFEIYTYQDTGGTRNVNVNSVIYTYFQGCFLRGA